MSAAWPTREVQGIYPTTGPATTRLVFLDWVRIGAFGLLVAYRYGYTGTYPEFMRLYLAGYAGFCQTGSACLILPTWNHLWFLPYLLCYTLIAWLIVRALPGALDRAAGWLAAWPGVAGLMFWPIIYLATARYLLQSRFPDTRALVDDWHAHSHFFAAFGLGLLLARAPAMWARFATLRWMALGAALLAWLLLVGAGVAWGPWWRLPGALAPVLIAVQQWCAIAAVLGFASPHLHADGPLRRYLTEAVFPVYILHQTAIILLAWWFAAYALPVALDGPLLVVVTLVLCFALFECVRHWRWARPLFGLQAAAP